ncbi:MAG: hypothetical protein M3297_02080 [Thermoproteota archaeon]|nr:hypothetical protein [Thermoproteota archaeon]
MKSKLLIYYYTNIMETRLTELEAEKDIIKREKGTPTNEVKILKDKSIPELL